MSVISIAQCHCYICIAQRRFLEFGSEMFPALQPQPRASPGGDMEAAVKKSEFRIGRVEKELR